MQQIVNKHTAMAGNLFTFLSFKSSLRFFNLELLQNLFQTMSPFAMGELLLIIEKSCQLWQADILDNNGRPLM